MRCFTIRPSPLLLVNNSRQYCKQLLPCIRTFAQKTLYTEPSVQLWSDGGTNIQSSIDNTGGWQTDRSSLLNFVDINSIKYQSLKGLKDINEDRVQVRELAPNVLFIGVFDGHGGPFVVDFVSENLHLYVKHLLEQGKASLTTALRRGFIDCDVSLAIEVESNSNKTLLRSGSTATVALLKNGEELAIASVGDSRAILCHDGQAMLLTNDHTPASTDEKNRVLARGGSVDCDGKMTPRVNGRLAMTRCFGNFDLKSYGVIPVPEIQTLDIDQNKDNFLALITDGISAVMTTDEAVNMMLSCEDPRESVEMVTTCAAQFGSEDDNTAVLLPFRSFGKRLLSQSDQGVIYRANLRSVITKYE